MVLGVKGPKAVLSTAIASALDEYFVVDPDLIESNLLSDTKIVLRDVKLRPQKATIVPKNSVGYPTIISVTGHVEEVSFTWIWSSWGEGGESWVKDAVLTIRGMKFKATLNHDVRPTTSTSIGEHGNKSNPTTEKIILPVDGHSSNKSVRRPSFKKALEENEVEIKKEGGLNAYIKKQIEIIVDTLTLDVLDFELTVEMPPPLQISPCDEKKNADTVAEEKEAEESEKIAIIVGGHKVEFNSLGRFTMSDKEEASTAKSVGNILKQRVTMESLYVNIVNHQHTKSSDEDKAIEKLTHPLMEKFSYIAEANRAGRRFAGFVKGLDVRGIISNVAGDTHEGDLVFHAGTEQFEALTQLGVMLLAPRDDNDSPNDIIKQDSEDGNMTIAKVSTFVFPVSSVSLILQKTTRVSLPNVVATYHADGTVMNVEAEQFELLQQSINDDDTPEKSLSKRTTKQLSVSGIRATMRPQIKIDLDKVETLYVRDVLELTTPIEKTTLTYVGTTLTVLVDSIEFIKLHKEQNEALDKIAATPHHFQEHTYGVPTKCAVCGGLLKGLWAQGIQCKDCMMDVHNTGGCRTAALSSSCPGVAHVEAKEVTNVSNGDCEIVDKAVSSVSTATPHILQPHTYGVPTNCEICGGLLKGLWSQGVQCKICMVNVHDKEDCRAAILCSSCPGVAKEYEKLSSGASGGVTMSNDSSARNNSVPTNRLKKLDNEGGDESVSSVTVPFPVNVSVQTIRVKSSIDGSLMHFKNLDVFLNPDNESNSTHIAFCLEEFTNELLQLRNVNVYALLPLDRPDEVQAFNAMADSASVTAGHSKEEWKEKFEPQSEKNRAKAETIKLPHATIARLNLTISWKGSGVSLQETKVSIPQFMGKASTTSKDLVNYYASACLTHAPGFVSNLDIAGLNVVDTAASTWASMLVPGGGGVVAIAAVDAVKGAVAAGKKSRNVDDGNGWQLGDFYRGIVYATGEATRAGATKRGKVLGKGNDIVDFAVGVTDATGDYIGQNKARLGGAGAAGAGFIYGTLIGGPLVGIIGGVVANAVAQKSIETAEEMASRHSIEEAENTLKLENAVDISSIDKATTNEENEENN